MRTYNLTIDLETGAMFAIDRNGARRSLAELQDAEARAQRGDPDALATLLAVDVGLDHEGEQLDYDKMMQAIMHDCPDCQAARARGEEPLVFSSAELERLMAGPGPSRQTRERARARRRRRRFRR
jgi:hypothetical protein